MSTFIWTNGAVEFLVSLDNLVYLNCAADVVPPHPQKSLYTANGRFLYQYGNPAWIADRLDAHRIAIADRPAASCSRADSVTKPIGCEELYHLLSDQTQKIVLYTGAGLSRAAGILTQEELIRLLWLEDIPTLCTHLLKNPFLIINRFKLAASSYRKITPTPAHWAIRRMLQQQNRILVSENVDTLHQQTGVVPLSPFRQEKLLAEIHPYAVVFIGIGNPECKRLLYHWMDSGSRFYALGLKPPLLPGATLHLCTQKIEDFFAKLDGGAYD